MHPNAGILIFLQSNTLSRRITDKKVGQQYFCKLSFSFAYQYIATIFHFESNLFFKLIGTYPTSYQCSSFDTTTRALYFKSFQISEVKGFCYYVCKIDGVLQRKFNLAPIIHIRQELSVDFGELNLHFISKNCAQKVVKNLERTLIAIQSNTTKPQVS